MARTVAKIPQERMKNVLQLHFGAEIINLKEASEFMVTK